MATYYVGAGGLDANSGLTWALRKLTLNGAEDIPVVANDTVYVGPGVYRELLTCDVSGAAGQPITYIGDVTGEHTDGVGGTVRTTGSDTDLVAFRANCITTGGAARNYRTFQGFAFDTTTSNMILSSGNGTNWTISDCFFGKSAGSSSIYFGGTGTNHLIQRCVFDTHSNGNAVAFSHTVVVDNAGHVVSNCLIVAGFNGIAITRVGGITVKNLTVLRGTRGVYIDMALTVGQTVQVNNCIFTGCSTVALQATALGEIVENYNTFFANFADRTTVNVGANSVTYPPLFMPPILLAGFRYPWLIGSLSNWSAVRTLAGMGEPLDDLFGIARPVTSAKNSWGAIQFDQTVRETGTVRTGVSSLELTDASRKQFIVPSGPMQTTVSMYVYREANYAGTNPQMVIKQPGQADRVTTDAGAAGVWNQLTGTFTPSALPDYFIIEIVSNNTAVAGAYAVYFDDLVVR